ncbi:MAG: sugar ABC transporter permease [Fusobacteriaceae bacterium]|jgi:putative multiple sugar transport system permease protein|nr:sugar ABC transporter permease [Fusobacteriaceae bacterium]
MNTLLTLLKKNSRQYGMVIALAAAMILFGFLTNGVLFRPVNLTNLVLQNSYVLVLAVGMLLCILTGNVDLSVGSVVAFVGAVSAVMMVDSHMNSFLAIIASLLVGAAIGAWQGFWIAYVKVPAFIVTLAGMLIFRGLAQVILKGQSKGPFPKMFQLISSGYIPDPLGGFAVSETTKFHLLTVVIGLVLTGLFILSEIKKRKKQKEYKFDLLPGGIWMMKLVFISAVIMTFMLVFAVYRGLPNILVLLGILVAVYHFITSKTVQGRHIYALGGNMKAAKLSGIKTERVMFWVYTNMGIISALAGMVFAARLNVATPKAGQSFELDAIAACYIGGASTTGGIGTIIGAIVGGLFMGVLNNGMSIMGVSIDWQQAIKGFVLLAAVAFDLYSKARSSK